MPVSFALALKFDGVLGGETSVVVTLITPLELAAYVGASVRVALIEKE